MNSRAGYFQCLNEQIQAKKQKIEELTCQLERYKQEHLEMQSVPMDNPKNVIK
eukprot:CAMPEP_0168351216 /NCGR_PEP_ID=MMETSP0213-20121227/21691_1 /TAXON_ID=151035 /ORGANISM="Euplotes harpa, Strain FSP1.4" /LENGTH=52 /DNA_ID=CAMNT_0008361929 /DNA_START=1 /DNA_END=156 /DNA_ORIENTATION=+